jgi:DNA polymerase-2
MMLEFWLSTETGARCIRFPKQEAVVFCAQSEAQYIPTLTGLRIEKSHLKHFSGEQVCALYCSKYQTLTQLRRYCEDNHIPLWEAEIKPADRFLMERFIKGSMEFEDVNSTAQTLEGIKIRPSRYSPRLKLCSVDIETSMPTRTKREVLYSIGFCTEWADERGVTQRENKVLMLDEALDGDKTNEELPEWLQLFRTTKELLVAANIYMAQLDPDVLIGWNVVNFDFTVLARIYAEQQVPFNWGRQQHTIRLRSGQNNFTFAEIPGRVIVDGIDALKSATYHFDSFALQFVSEQLLDSGKDLQGHEGDMSDRGQTITDLFLQNKLALAKYNLQDCKLVLDIFEKTQIMDYLIQRSHLTGHNLDRVGGSVAAFEFLYLPKLHRAGYIAPNLMEGFSDIKAPGGFVMDSQPGFYDDVLVLDFKSLYPSIIRTFKIDPMGLIEGLNLSDEDKASQAIPGFHGAYFHRENHFLPDIIQTLWSQRDEAKKQNNDAASQAIKIIMNSFYGVLGSYGCRFFDARLASSITERGHEIIQKSAQWINNQGYNVIYGDTDSVFVHLKGKASGEQAKEIGRGLQESLNQFWKELLTETYQLSSCLEIEFESHYTKFLMPTIRGSETGSKKRYAGLLEKNCDHKELVFKGLEAVRSDWTALAKEIQTELYRRIFNGEAYETYLQSIVSELKGGERDHQLTYKKRIRKPLDTYTKNIPPQIQAAKKAQVFYERHERNNPYENGGWIEYGITLSGPEAKECRTTQYDYQHYIDKQIAPVADGILHFLGMTFHQLVDPQHDIFS